MEKVNKILFLDVDGVLNSKEWFTHYMLNEDIYGDCVSEFFDPRAVQRIVEICDACNAKIILTSPSWKYDTYKETKDSLTKFGDTSLTTLLDYVIGITPQFGTKPIEVNLFMLNHMNNEKNCYVDPNIEFETYVDYIIIDSENDYYDDQELYEIDPLYGITNQDKINIIKMLKD